MQWEKLGLIFKTEDHLINNKKILFSQSPQTICFDNFVRVYFSTRIIDNKAKYLSKITYVDFKKDFSEVIKVAQHEVMPLGALGCYDEHGIFPLNVVPVDDLIYGYIGGWNRRVSVMIDGSIGLAISKDKGETFQRLGDGPILGPTIKEPFLVADPYVKIFDGVFHMWYIYGEKWVTCKVTKNPERIYKISHATSTDGIHWNRDGKFIVDEILDEYESQALPTVVKINDIYHMYFCYRYATNFRNKDRGYRLGHAFSKDLINWVRDDQQMNLKLSENPLSWDAEMICYPNLFEMDNEVYMMYNGNAFGREGFGLAKLIK